MFTVDGMQWTFPCDIQRVSEITASDISGMLLNKNYFNDVVGTFLKYTVTIVVPFGSISDYTRLYEILTDAVDAHSFVLPYNQGTITITGRVSSVSDVYRRLADGTTHWSGIQFSVIANSPNKTHSLGEAIQRGLSPLPNIVGAVQGDTYTFDGSSWVPFSGYPDADNRSY